MIKPVTSIFDHNLHHISILKDKRYRPAKSYNLYTGLDGVHVTDFILVNWPCQTRYYFTFTGMS
jgi:hypothetical protein